MFQLQANNNNKNIYLPNVEMGSPPSSLTASSDNDIHKLNLYNLCVKSIVSKLDKYHHNLACLPVNLQFDLYHEMFMNEQWSNLNRYMVDVTNFINLLMYNKGHRQTLHMLLQRLMDEGSNLTNVLGTRISQEVLCMLERAKRAEKANNQEEIDHQRKLQIRFMQRVYSLAGFFIEAGWYMDAKWILSACLKFSLKRLDEEEIIVESWYFRIKTRLLAALVGYSCFEEANQLYKELESLIDERNYVNLQDQFDLAQVYNEFACLFAAQSLFKETYKWSCQAMAHLTDKTPKISLIDILLTTSKSCVIKRDFEIADFLLRQALLLCKELFQLNKECDFTQINRFHPIIGDLFNALGYYYHNIDIHEQSVKFYLNSVNFRKQYFGLHTPTEQCINLPLALARQELAFEYYIQEYSTGHFELSLYHIELAKISLDTLLRPGHHLFSNVLRIKALIIEEQAIDNTDIVVKSEMLMKANLLHREALHISRQVLGEENLQTAKHYSNLGRLYQTMHRYEDSETLQLRSIEIKEKCLGSEDFEVAQSYGFLASLYSYDMEMYLQAESYYLKAIDIGTKVFGGAYSGHEFDYAGLIRIYMKTGETEKADEYVNLLREWKSERYSLISSRSNKIDLCSCLTDESLVPLNSLEIKQYFLTNRLHQV